MEFRPTSDQEAFIRHALESGRIAQPEDAVVEAMALWEERERRRLEIMSHIDAAEASLASGQGLAVTQEAMAGLAHDVKQRGRARLAGEGNAAR
jgi:Arc/MetJ-type ribon-helix-helix transcriptional regulator